LSTCLTSTSVRCKTVRQKRPDFSKDAQTKTNRQSSTL